jgi:hypothetical protein
MLTTLAIIWGISGIRHLVALLLSVNSGRNCFSSSSPGSGSSFSARVPSGAARFRSTRRTGVHFTKFHFARKRLRVKFHPKILDEFPSKNSRQMCIPLFWILILGFMAQKSDQNFLWTYIDRYLNKSTFTTSAQTCSYNWLQGRLQSAVLELREVLHAQRVPPDEGLREPPDRVRARSHRRGHRQAVRRRLLVMEFWIYISAEKYVDY